MADYQINLRAAEQIDLAISGNYFRVLEASDDVWISVDGGALQKRSAGIGELIESGFSRLSIYSDVNQTVLLSVSYGRIDDNRLTLTPGAVVQVDAGKFGLGKYITGVASSAAGGSLEVIAPSANVNGIRVLGFFQTNNVPDLIFLYAAPSNVGPYTNNPMLSVIYSYGMALSSLPAVVPAGLGIYIGTSNNSGGVLIGANVTYEVIA